MTAILALDTASPAPAVTVLTDAAACDEPISSDRRASERLLAAIAACLARAGVTLHDCRRIAVCSGPGSFTGVRVGLATAWGLARATGADLEPVSTLAVLAEASRGSGRKVLACAMDAGRGEVVWQAFDLSGARARPLREPARSTPDEAASAASGLAFASMPEGLLGGRVTALPASQPLSLALARAVARQPSEDHLPALSAVYARPSAAEEKHGGS